MTTDFDTEMIQNTVLRTHYQMLERRFAEISGFVEQAYGFNKRKISSGFTASNQAGATAKRTEDGYSIRISSALPQALSLLFAHFLADPEAMPWLAASDPSNTDPLALEVAPNPGDLTDRQNVHIPNNTTRNQVAEILADIAVNFVFMHELGHVLAGHTDLPGTDGELREITEFSLVELAAPEPSEQARAWEYEADVVGAGLMSTQIDALIAMARADDDNSREIFGPPQIAVEQCLSLTAIALYALFRYLRGANQRLNLIGNHPDPLIRAFCVRDALYQATSQRHAINSDLLEELLSARFEEFDDALEAANIQAGMTLDDTAIEEINQQVSALIRSRKKLRHLTREYRYIDWD
ncbi:hypothetical protein [Thalassobius sp. I31.1]|uniref:hypothetical protein n=1 Tax=Thalassobius sp. I31.1 TaxID=2109912 RepID=UPI000D1A19D3|nr:hypothetical protein [Thalassobius sp. I31.1]